MNLRRLVSRALWCSAFVVTGVGVAQAAPTRADSASASHSTTRSALQVPSPDWRDQVIYFVMTDRFDDGNPANNDQGAGEYDPADPRKYSGGDIAGITRRLGYIQQLGATAVWLTPPVANQWWSQHAQYGGYHGYWATDFAALDPHVGTLDEYQRLSRALHGRGMYLIQDIVANHTGNFFGYQGAYDPSNPQQHFVLYEPANSRQPRPTQFPFDQLDVRDAHQAAMAAYHFTPSAERGSDEFTYQLATLADINTSNPLVRQTLKQSYRDWIEQAGVDAFRVDTAKYVEHEFWHDFFHSRDGIQAKAKALGKHDFLSFGEVFEGSLPYQNEGEQKLQAFLGSTEKPELDSVIAFPLYFELNRVLAEGQPPAQLAYRIEQQQRLPNFARMPTFLNNHDTQRFLASGSVAAFIQGYAVLFTIPGIPVIYQGDEQLLRQSRQAMFAGGYGSKEDMFNAQQPMYSVIQGLATLRQQHRVLRRGQWQLLQAEPSQAGILAYQMHDATERIVVLLNTADQPRMVAGLPLAAASQTLPLLWSNDQSDAVLQTNAAGELTVELPARAVRVLQLPVTSPQQPLENPANLARLTLHMPLTGQVFREDSWLVGQGALPRSQVHPILDGDAHALTAVQADDRGHFKLPLPVRDFGHTKHSLVLWSAMSQQTSARYEFSTEVHQAEIALRQKDPRGDDHGPTGQYRGPTHAQSQQQRDLLEVEVQAGGSTLELRLSMAQLSYVWAPVNGFDNVLFSLFFEVPALADKPQQTELPGLAAAFPATDRGKAGHWQLGHRLYGWGNSLFSAEGASANQIGTPLGAAPEVKVDIAKHQLLIRYQGRAFGVHDWAGTRIFISTWDISGEGELRELTPDGGPWQFGGGTPDGPKWLDSVLLQLPDPTR